MISKKQFIKVIIGIILVNIIVISGIVIFVNNKMKAHVYTTEDGQEYVNEPVDSSGINAADLVYADDEDEELNLEIDRNTALDRIKNQNSKETSYNQIYTSLLPGVYILEDGKSFSFTKTGAFNGYFNADNPEVTGYSYELSIDKDDNNIVTIYNPKKTESVKYILRFESTGIVLKVPDSDISFLLPTE